MLESRDDGSGVQPISANARNPGPHSESAQMIFNNDVNSLTKYVQRKNDCNLHTCVLAPLTMAAAGGETSPVGVYRTEETHPIPPYSKRRRPQRQAPRIRRW